MLVELNRKLRNTFPRLHATLKRPFQQTNIPFPKLILGHYAWTRPNLVTEQPAEDHILRWTEKILRPGDTFFDVGAHHGWVSLVAARKVGPTGHVVAFEPSPPSLEILQYHKMANNLPQLQVEPRPVSASVGQTAPFYLVAGGASQMNSLLALPAESDSRSSRKPECVDLPTVTLDAFAREFKLLPAAIKIDVEGAELWALEGAKILCEHVRPVLLVAIHPPWLPDGQTPDDIFALLEKYSYRIADSHSLIYEGADFGDYLCVPE